MGRVAVQIYAASSLDGYLAPPDGSVDWLESFDAGIDLGYDAFYSDVGSIISGRTTYEQLLTFGGWPYEGKPLVVVSTRPQPDELPDGVSWSSGEDLAGLVKELATEASGNVWLLGGGELHRTFLAAGLVDEIWTHVMPLMLGDGIAMFPAPYPGLRVALIETRTYANGVVMLRYRVASGRERA